MMKVFAYEERYDELNVLMCRRTGTLAKSMCLCLCSGGTFNPARTHDIFYMTIRLLHQDISSIDLKIAYL